VFIGTAVFPVPFEVYSEPLRIRYISPFQVIGIDIEFYMWRAEIAAEAGYVQFLLDAVKSDMAGAPVFSLLVALFDYGPGHTLPLATTWLIMSMILAGGWIAFLARNGLGLSWLCLFALLPNPMLYALVVGPDLLFAAGFGLFFWGYFRDRPRLALWASALLIEILIRPNGLALAVFVIADCLWRRPSDPTDWLVVTILSALMIWMASRYLPALSTYAAGASQELGFGYFGFAESELRAGAFGVLPKSIDLGLSWLLLGASKILYFVGLRPSFVEGSMVTWLVRGAASIVLLPGLLRMAVVGAARERFLLLFFVTPVLVGLAQDRYNLPILPLLFLHGALFWNAILRRARALGAGGG